MSADVHVSVAGWPVVKVYHGWGINPKHGLGIEGSIFNIVPETFKQICVNILSEIFYPCF